MTTETILTDDMSLIEQLRGYAANNGYSHNDYADTMTAAADALEQAVLQSPEIQALREDAERYRWITATNSGPIGVVIYDEDGGFDVAGLQADDAIDSAMEQKK